MKVEVCDRPEEVSERVGSLLDEGWCVVFPSEVVRRSFLAALARRCGGIDAGRLHTWDRFVRDRFVGQGRIPAGPLHRVWAAAVLLSREEAQDYLAPVFGEVWERGGLEGFLASVLPEVLLLDLGGRGDAPWDRALSWLAEGYREVLEEAGLYETEEEVKRAAKEGRAPGERVAVVYPELYTAVGVSWEVLGPSWLGLSLRAGVPEDAPVLVCYPDAVSEVRAALMEVRDALGAGEEVDLVVADRGLVGLLSEEADLLGIPLSPEVGRALREVPGVRLLFLLDEARRGGWDFDSVRDLLLAGDVPWREGWGEAVREAVERKVWDRRGWERVGRVGELLRAVQGVMEAESFGALRKGLDSWVQGWLGAWADDAEQRAWGFARGLLVHLSLLEGRTGVRVGRPWEVWIEALKAVPYVPGGGEGVPVYPYRVSAGAVGGRRWVLGASAEGVEVASIPVEFLPEDERGRLGVSTRRFTESFVYAYLRSGARMSMHRVQEEITHEVPSVFLLEGTVEERGMAEDHPLAVEQRVWRGEVVDVRPTEAMVEGLRRVGEVRGRWGKGAEPLGGVAGELLERHGMRKGNELLLSPTVVQGFYECGLRAWYERVGGVEEASFRPGFVDRRSLGIVYHALLEEVFSPYVGRLLSEVRLPEDFRVRVEKELEKHGAVAREFIEVVADRVTARLEGVIERLKRLFSGTPPAQGARVGRIEGWERSPIAEGLALRGRLDLLVEDGAGNPVLFDFKYTNVPSFPHPDRLEEGRRFEMQLLLYALLLERQEKRLVEDALYVSVEKDEVLSLRKRLGSRGNRNTQVYRNDEGLEGLFERLERTLVEIGQRMEGGEISYAEDRDVCTTRTGGCPFRRVCRVRYTVREEE